MTRNALVLLALAISIATFGVVGSATASTPANIEVSMPLSNDEPVVSWNAVDGAHQYQLTGTIYALRVNAADPFCADPLQDDSQTLTVGEPVDPPTTQFQLPLPELPSEDAWFIYDARVTVEAFNSEGVLLANGSAQGIAETNATHCQTPEPDLPTTGSGQGRTSPTPAVLALAAAALVVLGSFTVWRSVTRG